MSRIRLTWNNASTTIVEQRVYRSISPLDINDMPDPLAVLPRRNRGYLDSTIEDGLAYYYAISSVLPDYSELISEEIKIEAAPGESDPHWDKVVALLHMDIDFADETGKSWAPINQPLIDHSTLKFGGGSGFFSGSSCIEGPASADWAFGTGDFTVECWAYATSMPTGLYFSPIGNWVASTGGCFFLRPSGVMSWHGAGLGYASASGVFAINTWHHIAYSRQNGTGRLFVDGVQVASAADSVNYTWTQSFRVGNNRTATDYWRGYIDDPRITKGVARYTENFTPPTGPFPNN